MSALTDKDLAAARELCERATQPGPWVSVVQDGNATVLDAHSMWVADCGAAPNDAAFIATSRTLVPSLLDLVSQQVARIAELEEQSGHERDHSKMLSEANSALHVEKRAIENYCAKVRGEYTEAARERNSLRSQLAAVTRERDEARTWAKEVIARWERDTRKHVAERDAAIRERDEARAANVTLHRGYRDLHDMMPGTKDVWSKVADLRRLLREACEIAERLRVAPCHCVASDSDDISCPTCGAWIQKDGVGRLHAGCPPVGHRITAIKAEAGIE